MSKSLGQCLRRHRAIAQLTLRQVEEACGVSNAYLSQLENDKIKKPSANVLYKIAQLYGVSIDVFLVAAGIIADDPKRPTMLSSGALSSEEENLLLEYLAFLRSKKPATLNTPTKP